MTKLYLAQLKEAKACKEQVELFAKLFGDYVEVTPEACLAVADKFDWTWAAQNLLSVKSYAEYQRQQAPLWAEYLRQEAPLWAEYQRQMASLYAEYERQRVPLWEEYKRQQAPLYAEYLRQRALLYAEYQRQRALLWARCYIEKL